MWRTSTLQGSRPRCHPRPPHRLARRRPQCPHPALLGRRPDSTTVPAVSNGTTPYRVPVADPDRAGWGDTHSEYPAADIFVGCGALIVAPVNGVVSESRRVNSYDPSVDNPATRGGRSVTIIGDDGVRYYLAHFERIEDRIEPGVRVTIGAAARRDGSNWPGLGLPRPLRNHPRRAQPKSWSVTARRRHGRSPTSTTGATEANAARRPRSSNGSPSTRRRAQTRMADRPRRRLVTRPDAVRQPRLQLNLPTQES